MVGVVVVGFLGVIGGLEVVFVGSRSEVEGCV